MTIVRIIHKMLHLMTVGGIRIVAGTDAALRYHDRNRP